MVKAFQNRHKCEVAAPSFHPAVKPPPPSTSKSIQKRSCKVKAFSKQTQGVRWQHHLYLQLIPALTGWNPVLARGPEGQLSALSYFLYLFMSPTS
jgi:hypothetical protein